MSYQYSENQWGERYIDALGRSVFDTQPSRQVYDNSLELDLEKEDALYLVLGSDSGLLIRYLSQMDMPPGTRFAFIEPDDIFDSIVQECPDIVDREGKVRQQGDVTQLTLHRQSQWKSEVFDGNDMHWLIGGTIQLIESQACKMDYTHVYLALYKSVHADVEARRFDIIAKISTKSFVRAQLLNAADNTASIAVQPELGRGYTAVVIGGGPSIDKHLPWILENRDRLFIIAVSRLCDTLDKLSLKPDLIVSVDPVAGSYDVSKHGILWTDVPLVVTPFAAPQLVQEWQGPIFYTGDRLPWANSIDQSHENRMQTSGPTVGHRATVVASQLGFTTILLTGIDLCYDSVRSHSKDSPEAALLALPSHYDAQVETYSGKMAGSRVHWLQTAPSLEYIGASINQYTPVVFNLNEGAMKIDSIPYRPIQDVQLPDSKPDFSANVEAFHAVDRVDDLNRLDKELKFAHSKFHNVKKLCEQAQTNIDRMYDPKNEHKKAVYADRLEKIEHKLNKQLPDYVKSLLHYGGTEIATLLRPRGFATMKDEDQEAWIEGYYKALADGADEFIVMIKDAKIRSALRRDEYERRIRIGELIERWEADFTPGRIQRITPENWPDLDSSEQALVDRALATYREQFNNHKDTTMNHVLVSMSVDITKCMRSLTYLYFIRNTEDLQTLTTTINGDEWPGNILLDFTHGLLAELDSQHQEAINRYQKVIDQCSSKLENSAEELSSMQRIVEESLARMTQANIALGDYATACETLGTLCEILPQYILSYAKLLNLCNESDNAVAILNLYMDVFPTHWQAAQLQHDILVKSGKESEAKAALQRSQEIREEIRRKRSEAA